MTEPPAPGRPASPSEPVFLPLVKPEDGTSSSPVWKGFLRLSVGDVVIGICLDSLRSEFLERYHHVCTASPAITPFAAAFLVYAVGNAWLDPSNPNAHPLS